MDVIDKLKEVRYLVINQEYLKNKYNELENKKTPINSASCLENTSSVIDFNLLEQEEILRELERTENSIKELREDLMQYTKHLEPRERVIIELHCIHGETLEYICSVVHYSFRHTQRVYKKALQKLKDVVKST